ncbi:MAG: hypothetical protein ACFFCS_03530 [Candidatus Hodarchaeota archaeon]
MPRKIDREKYERILKRLAKGETQAHIVEAESCSYATIASAKQWDKDGRPASLHIKQPNSKSNTTQIVVSMPNYWLGIVNEKIEEGRWRNYSDAVLDLFRTYLREEGLGNGDKLKELKAAQQKRGLGSIRKEMKPKLEERKTLLVQNPQVVEKFGEKKVFEWLSRPEFKGLLGKDLGLGKKLLSEASATRNRYESALREAYPELMEKYGGDFDEFISSPEYAELVKNPDENFKKIKKELEIISPGLQIETRNEEKKAKLTQVLCCPTCNHEQQFPTHCWVGDSAIMEFEGDHFTCEKCDEELPVPTCPKCDQPLVARIKTLKEDKRE